MKNIAFISLCIFAILINISLKGNAISSCNGPCNTLDDCNGQLICINGKCNDDPDVGSHTCHGGGGGGRGVSGSSRGGTKPKYRGSSPVSSATAAKLTLNDFSEGGDGGGPSECDERYHDNGERVVALSTRWYAGGSRCGRMVRITARNGRSTAAKVVDECDERGGCDNNVVDGSKAVWEALGLDQDLGVVPVTWSMA